MSHDDEAITNDSPNPHINDLIDRRLQDSKRRSLFKSGMGLAALSFIGSGSAMLVGCGGDDDPAPAPAPAPAPPPPPLPPAGPARPSALGFGAVPKSLADSVVLASGYTSSVLFRLGDPIAAGVPAYANDGTDAANTFDRRAGDHHDGIYYFGLSANGTFSATSSDRGLLVQNHEAITPVFLHPTGQTIVACAHRSRRSAARVLRAWGERHRSDPHSGCLVVQPKFDIQPPRSHADAGGALRPGAWLGADDHQVLYRRYAHARDDQ